MSISRSMRIYTQVCFAVEVLSTLGEKNINLFYVLTTGAAEEVAYLAPNIPVLVEDDAGEEIPRENDDIIPLETSKEIQNIQPAGNDRSHDSALYDSQQSQLSVTYESQFSQESVVLDVYNSQVRVCGVG